MCIMMSVLILGSGFDRLIKMKGNVWVRRGEGYQNSEFREYTR